MAKKLLIFILLFLTSCNEQVDLIVYNANVFTSNNENPSASAFAVKDGKFIYVGDDSVMSEFSSSNIVNAEDLQFTLALLILMLIFMDLGFERSSRLKEQKSWGNCWESYWIW